MMLFAMAVLAIASGQVEAKTFDDSSSPLCDAHPLDADVFTSLHSSHFCLQPLVVPSGQSAQLFFANLEAYCTGVNEDEKPLAKVTSGDSTVVNFCNTDARSLSLSTGTYHIGVSASTTPLKVSLTYHKAVLGCDDVVDDSLIDIPLSFVPTEHKCSIVLPGRTVLEIKNIRIIEHASENPRQCARVRMGKTFYSLHVIWAPVCEIAGDDSVTYDLGCGAVVMDASSLAVEKVEFVLRAMDEYQAVVAPLMCAD